MFKNIIFYTIVLGIGTGIIYDYFNTKTNNLILKDIINNQDKIIILQQNAVKISNEVIKKLTTNNELITQDYKGIDNELKNYFKINHDNDIIVNDKLLAIYNKAINVGQETSRGSNRTNAASAPVTTSKLMDNIMVNYHNFTINANRIKAWQEFYTKLKEEYNK